MLVVEAAMSANSSVPVGDWSCSEVHRVRLIESIELAISEVDSRFSDDKLAQLFGHESCLLAVLVSMLEGSARAVPRCFSDFLHLADPRVSIAVWILSDSIKLSLLKTVCDKQNLIFWDSRTQPESPSPNSNMRRTQWSEDEDLVAGNAWCCPMLMARVVRLVKGYPD